MLSSYYHSKAYPSYITPHTQVCDSSLYTKEKLKNFNIFYLVSHTSQSVKNKTKTFQKYKMYDKYLTEIISF